jgi:uncharacterized protein with von Willebrand factor type A (vWA) domain
MAGTIDSTISNRDYVVIIDKSGSMTGCDCPGGKSRWEYCQESVQALVSKVCQLDPDGVDMYLFSTKHFVFENVTVSKVKEIFTQNSPQGSTYFAPVLESALKKHFDKAQRSTTILVITDGEANDPHETAKALINASNKIEADSELSISFIQIGKDPSAKYFLQKLDDELTGAGAKFDIVDTVTMDDFDNKPLEEILFNAILD